MAFKRNLIAILVMLGLVATLPTAAAAACRWEWDCSKGYPCKQVQVCDDANDATPIKPRTTVEPPAIKLPGVSPIPGQYIPPAPGPAVPPVGTSGCRQTQVCDGNNCRWDTVCR